MKTIEYKAREAARTEGGMKKGGSYRPPWMKSSEVQEALDGWEIFYKE